MTPLERAARAACEAAGQPWSDDSGGARSRSQWERVAKAVLQAIREPSEAMIDKGRDAGEICEAVGCIADACWQAMIDTALEEG